MTTLRPLILAAALACCGAAHADVTVKDAWVRATVAAQKTTGAFMQLNATSATRLIEVRSPAAARVEIHEMAMDGDTMTMRAVKAVDLPAGQTVELKPGGFHIMMMGLKQGLKAGDSVPVTLVLEGADKKRETVEIQAPVRALGATANTKN
ncbi:MAG: copper chaperone PCu(A)C [Leptothrix sp. (in: b-proteobacteria)]